MSFVRIALALGALGGPLAALLAAQAPCAAPGGCAPASFCQTGGAACCQRHDCPPPYIHCQERPPHIRFRKTCPRPVCGPCELEHWGYYQPCWRPWPWPPDWSHCPYPTPASMIALPPPPPGAEGVTIRPPSAGVSISEAPAPLPPARKIGPLPVPEK